VAAKSGASHVGSRQNDQPKWSATGHVTGGGGIRHFSNNSTTKQYFKILISHNRRVFLASSLLQCQSSPISFLQAVKRESVSYIVNMGQPRAKKGSRSQSATLHSTGNISAEDSVYKNKAGHNSTRGIVSSLLFFLLKLLLHTVYIFNIFMWTENSMSSTLLMHPIFLIFNAAILGWLLLDVLP
jgi:hypothetical protein